MKNALIIFSAVPGRNETTPRLAPFLEENECEKLYACFLKDIYGKALKTGADVLVFFTPDSGEARMREILGDRARYLPQFGDHIGIRMKNAIGIALRLGYEKCILIGSDCPQIHAETLIQAFDNLDKKDVVIHPTLDGGYYLIGMKREYDSIWEIERYGTNTVIYDTLKHMRNEHLSTSIGQLYYDVDDVEDLRRLYRDVAAGIIDNCPFTAEYLRNDLREKLENGNE